MRVEVHQGERPVPPGGGPEQRQRDGVVAPDRHQPAATREQCVGARLDLAHRLLRAERRAGDVAGVHHLGLHEGQRLERRVVGAEEARALAHGGGAEAGAGPVAGAAVEGHADQCDVPAVHLVRRGQAGEGGEAGEAGDRGGVGGADGFLRPGHQSSMAW